MNIYKKGCGVLTYTCTFSSHSDQTWVNIPTSPLNLNHILVVSAYAASFLTYSTYTI